MPTYPRFDLNCAHHLYICNMLGPEALLLDPWTAQ